MPNPHYSMGPTSDAPVRPGTSAALTARTIDATIHSPLVRAQEAVTAALPALTAQPAMPLLAATVVFTAATAWVIARGRLHPTAILASALLLLPVSSYNGTSATLPLPPADASVADSDAGQSPVAEVYVPAPEVPDAEQPEVEIPDPVEAPEPADQYMPGVVDVPVPPRIVLPRELMRMMPHRAEWRAEQQTLRAQEAEMRRAMQQLRRQLKVELQHRARRYYSFSY